jgi:hypothetical protein
MSDATPSEQKTPSSSRSFNGTAFLTLLVLLIAAGIIAMNTWLLPLGNGRDELQILQVIDFYYTQRRFPELPEDWVDASWSAHHPPLYHMLMTTLIELGLPAPESHTAYRPNPFADQEVFPITPYNRVPLLASEGWGWPGEGAPQTWYMLRLVNVIFNLGAIWAMWKAARLFFDDKLGVPLALAFFTLAPAFLQFAVVVNHDSLILMFSALGTWLLLRTVKQGLYWPTTIALGVILGLGMLTKLFMAPLLLSAGLIFFIRPSREWPKAILHLATVAALTAIIAGWWYLRNYDLYGDFTAVKVNEQLVGSHRSDPMSLREAFDTGALWMGRLWFDAKLVKPTERWFQVFDWLGLGLLLTGLAALLARRERRITFTYGILTVFALCVPAILFMTYGASRNADGRSATVMRAGLPAVALLFAAAPLAWTPSRWRWAVTAPIIAGLIGVAIAFQALFFLPLYPPIRVENPDDVEIAHRLDIDFVNGVRLIGYEIPDYHLSPGDTGWIKLCWMAQTRVDADYAFTVQLVAPEVEPAALMNSYHVSGRYPTSIWEPGRAFCEDVPFKVWGGASRAYDVRVGLFTPDVEDIQYMLPDGTLTHYLIVDKIGVTEPADNPPNYAYRVDSWGGLVDYEAVVQDAELTVTLNWVGLGASEQPYGYFLHALDDDNNLLDQIDPAPGLPTNFWQAGVVTQDVLTLTLPPGTTHVDLGMYAPEGRRAEWTYDDVSGATSLTVWEANAE